MSLKPQTIYLSLVVIVVISAILRFYHLGEFKGPVFDEVYFPQYAYKYLTGIEFFHVHPPLYNYISMVGIWLYYNIPFITDIDFNSLSFNELDELSYRWVNALAGSFLGIIIVFTLLKFTKQPLFALLAGLFVAIDGSLVVDSRHGLNNIFLILFGFLGLWMTAKAHIDENKSHKWLLLGAVFLGCTVSIKWNGLSYILMLIAFFMMISAALFERYHLIKTKRLRKQFKNQSILRFDWWFYVLCFTVIPAGLYCLLWIPDRLFNTAYSFTEIHQQILGYHSSVVGNDRHPYCSNWYSWPLMERPISYYFSSRDVVEAGESVRYIRDVHLFGNPALYWLSSLAIVVMVGHWLKLFVHWYKTRQMNKHWPLYTLILLGFFAHYLSWVTVPRCVFLYHYQSASVFAFIALAWYISRGFYSSYGFFKGTSIVACFIILVAFIYWLPIVLGIELEASAYYQRMWFSRWI